MSLSEMQGTLDRAGDAFLERVFAPDERDAIPDGGDRLRHIASRFAVKEAVFKCLGATWTPSASFSDIVVGRTVGAPDVTVRGDFAAALAASGGQTLLVSLSVSGDTAIAVATLE